jgi:hypothetical protein
MPTLIIAEPAPPIAREEVIYNMDCLSRLHGREEARPRISVELHALDIDVAIVLWAPEFEQDVLP